MNAQILLPAVLGGVLIGLAAALFYALNGRIAGVSGVIGRVWTSADREWRIAFVAGLLAGGLVLSFVAPGVFGAPVTSSLLQLTLAGVLVGVGTQLANGCTSGHGVCGIGRGSLRSIVATLTFIFAGAVAVALANGRIL